MAEAVGLAFGILGAFNDAVQCFEYVQVARNFDQDFQTAILKLDISKLRLSRWGRSVGLDRVEKDMQSLPEVVGAQDDYEKAKEFLEQIVELFKDAETQSSKLKPAGEASSAHDPVGDLDEATLSLHKKLAALSLKRFNPGKLWKRTKWALYKEKYFSRLIQDITELVNGLIDLFPTARPEQLRLCKEEGSELASDENASLLAPIVSDIDPELNAALESERSGGDQTFNITFAGSKNYGLQQGYFSGQQTNNFGVRP
jgi:tetratricopeptide (TPR) repeat protein